MNNLQARFHNGLRYAKAGRHFILPTLILLVVIFSYLVEAAILLAEKLGQATRWSVTKLTTEYIDFPPVPEEDKLLDDTIQKLRALSIRELKRVASIQKLPKYGTLTKSELIDALVEQHKALSL
jgi:Rho termination factor, N-terminal domain